MSLLDEEQRVAAIIKDLEERVSNLEESSRSSVTPNPLVSVTDRATVGDRVDAVSSETVGDLEWTDDPASATAGGWDRAGWTD